MVRNDFSKEDFIKKNFLVQRLGVPLVFWWQTRQNLNHLCFAMTVFGKQTKNNFDQVCDAMTSFSQLLCSFVLLTYEETCRIAFPVDLTLVHMVISYKLSKWLGTLSEQLIIFIVKSTSPYGGWGKGG